jgi:nitrite reductase/ring-hydroxylating ferredoxin subunit
MADFIKVCTKGDISMNSAKSFVINGKRIAVFNAGGAFYCISSVCTHAGGLLEEGLVENEEVECPLHGSRFSLKTGAVTYPPAEQAVEKFELKLQGNDVLVKI